MILKTKAIAMIFFSLIPSLGIFFENKSRITDYIIFSTPRVIEGLLDLGNKLGFPVKLDHLLNFLFALFIGFTFLAYKKNREAIPTSYAKFVKMIYG